MRENGKKRGTYSPTPNEWGVKPGIDVGSPTSDRVLGRGELNGPSQDVDGGDEIGESTNPTVEGKVCVEGELGGVWESENGERSSLEGEEDAKGEEGEGDVPGSAGDSPPRFRDGVVGDVLLDLFIVDRPPLETVCGVGAGDVGGSLRADVVRTDEAEDCAEDEEEHDGEQLRVGG